MLVFYPLQSVLFLNLKGILNTNFVSQFSVFFDRIKPATRCHLIMIAALTLCVVALIAIGVVLGLQAAGAARRRGDGDGPSNNDELTYQNAVVAADAVECSEIGR